MFWKKKQPTPLKSDEYETIYKKLVSITGDLDSLLNRVALLDTMVKGNRMKLTKMSHDKIIDETESHINNEPRYI